MAGARPVRLLITFYVCVINLFFKIKEAKVDRTWVPAAAADPKVGGPWTAKQRVSARSNLPQIDAYMRAAYATLKCFCWYLLVKNLIISLLRSETFAPIRYLDCLLLGRYTINARVIELTPYCACYVASVRLMWVYKMGRQASEFRLPCVEFLLERAAHEQHWVGAPVRRSALLEYCAKFNEQLAGTARVGPVARLRPNRTRASWDELARTASLFFGLSAALFALLAVLLLRMGMPVVLTRRGFEYTYRHCIQWVRSGRQAAAAAATDANTKDAGGLLAFAQRLLYEELAHDSWHSGELGARATSSGPTSGSGPGFSRTAANDSAAAHYYRPQIIQEFLMPLEDVVRPSGFQALRVCLDVLETIIFYMDIGLLLNATCFMSVLLSKDVLIYCNAIQRRLERHIASGRANSPSPSSSPARRRRACAETADLQAQVADLLIMIDAYNKYISPQAQVHLFSWLGYSALVSSWIFVPGNESPKLEWYFIHCCTTLYVFLLLMYMSEVKTSCRRVHRLVLVAMGRDEGRDGRTKNIWLSLLTFYTPKPLYCFTVLDSVEITYLLGIKIIVWLFSALIVASSFFQVYNIK